MNVKKRIKRQVLILDSLSAVLVLVATLYCWRVTHTLPETFMIDPGVFHAKPVQLEESMLTI